MFLVPFFFFNLIYSFIYKKTQKQINRMGWRVEWESYVI